MPTKNHSEIDFTNRAIEMLKAYEVLEDLTPFSKYTHEVFAKSWNERITHIGENGSSIKPIEFLQIPFRIAEFNKDAAIKEQYKTYIETVQRRLGENTNVGDHLKKYQNLSPEKRPKRIFDDGDLFPEESDESVKEIAREFNFAYRFAQYAQICIEQGRGIFIDAFLGRPFEPSKSELLPNELRDVLNTPISMDSPKEFWEKWKEYFSPDYMTMEELDKFLKIFILSIDKEHPEKVALKEILLKARLLNVIVYPTEELDNPSEILFLKLAVLKEFSQKKTIEQENIKNKLSNITPEHDLSKTKEYLHQKWSTASLIMSLNNILSLIDLIKGLLKFDNINKEQLEQNQELLSRNSKFPILDKIELPLKSDSEPKWLYPLAQLVIQLKQHPQNVSLILNFLLDIKRGAVPVIEGDDPSELVPEFLVLFALAEFLSKDTRLIKIEEKEIEYPNFFNTNAASFRWPLIIGQIFAHPKISKFLTNFDFAKIVPVDLFKNLCDALIQILSVLNLNPDFLQNLKNQFNSMWDQLIQTNPDNIKETTNRILSKMQDLQQQLMSQQEKNDLEVSN